jgi:hypothetical protein
LPTFQLFKVSHETVNNIAFPVYNAITLCFQGTNPITAMIRSTFWRAIQMMGKSIVLAGFLGAMCMNVSAAVVVNLDGIVVSDISAIRYHAGGGIFELILNDNLACQGAASIDPLTGVGLGVGGQLYDVDGPITLDYSDGPVNLTIGSASGTLDCSSDRIFSDRLAKG